MLENIIGSKSKISILRILFRCGTKGITIRQLAMKSTTPYSVAYRDIELLEAEGFIKVRKKGRNNIVMLNADHEKYRKVSQLFSSDEKEVNRPKKMFRNDEALIIIHHNADPDAVGSAIAIARGFSQSNMKCDIFAPGGLSAQSKRLLAKYPYPILKKIEKYPSLVFILDTSSPEQIENIVIPQSCKKILIDHHTPGKLSDIADMKIIDPSAHSTAVLVYDLLISAGITMTAEIAFFLMAAIVADTGFFRLVDKRDINVIKELIEYVDMDNVFAALSTQVNYDEKMARMHSMQCSKTYTIDGKIVVFTEASSFESKIANFLMGSFADIAIVENISKTDVRISARARRYLDGKIDLSLLFKGIGKDIGGGGGGHSTVASANGSETDKIDIAREKIKVYIESTFRNKLKQL